MGHSAKNKKKTDKKQKHNKKATKTTKDVVVSSHVDEPKKKKHTKYHRVRTASAYRRYRTHLARIKKARHHSDMLSLPKTQIRNIARRVLTKDGPMHISKDAVNAIQHSVEDHIRHITTCLAIQAEAAGRPTVTVGDFQLLQQLTKSGPLCFASKPVVIAQ